MGVSIIEDLCPNQLLYWWWQNWFSNLSFIAGILMFERASSLCPASLFSTTVDLWFFLFFFFSSSACYCTLLLFDVQRVPICPVEAPFPVSVWHVPISLWALACFHKVFYVHLVSWFGISSFSKEPWLFLLGDWFQKPDSESQVCSSFLGLLPWAELRIILKYSSKSTVQSQQSQLYLKYSSKSTHSIPSPTVRTLAQT